jgi:hypothetical protein
MKTALKILRTGVVSLAVLVLFGRVAEAYALYPCADTYRRWASGLRMHRDQFSIPDWTEEGDSYVAAGVNWTSLISWQPMDFWWTYNDGGWITYGNGRSETALVERTVIRRKERARSVPVYGLPAHRVRH